MPGWELIGEEERAAVNEVFDHGGVLYRYGWADKRGNIYRVDNFERAFAEKMNIRHALALCSGTASLIAALKAMGISPGDEVITQSHTFIATVEAIREVGSGTDHSGCRSFAQHGSRRLREENYQKDKSGNSRPYDGCCCPYG